MQLNYASKYKSFRLPDQASVIGSCASHRLVVAKEDRPRPTTTPQNTGWLGRVARTTYTVCVTVNAHDVWRRPASVKRGS